MSSLILRGWTRRAGVACHEEACIPAPGWSCSRTRPPRPCGPPRAALPRGGPLGERLRFLLEARHGTERHLQPTLRLGRSLWSQDHGHERECLRKGRHGKRRQIHDEGRADAP
jgi:hypothetical protein